MATEPTHTFSSADPAAPRVQVVRWGRTTYADALARQTELQAARLAGTAPDTLVLTEHEPVFTVGLRTGAAKHLVWDAQNMRFTNDDEANQYIHPPYRSGWAL